MLNKICRLFYSVKLSYERKIVRILGIKFKINKIPTIINGYEDNQVFVVEEDGSEHLLKKNESIDGLTINFTGKNNVVRIEKPCGFIKKYPSRWNVQGNNNKFEIKRITTTMPTSISLCCSNDNQSLFIDENCSFGGLYIDMLENYSSVRIGKNCMFATNIYCITGDVHAILDKETHQLMNKAKGVVVGDNVWVGRNCFLGKNANIPEGCVLGISTTVASKLKVPPYSAVGGNPPKLIKQNILWERTSVNHYIEEIEK